MEFWIGRDGERYGPYTEAEIREWLKSGKMSGEDLAWREGLAGWQPLSVLLPDAAATAPASGSVPPDLPVPPRAAAAASPVYAGFWKRLLAYLLDMIVLYVPNMLIDRMLGGSVAQRSLAQSLEGAVGNIGAMLAAYQQYYAAMWPAMLLGAVMTWLYFAFCESSAWQATVGKRLLSIHVTDLEGRRISLPRALGRYGAKILSFLIFFIGVLMVGWTSRKQGLHDFLAGTLVVNGRAGTARAGSTPGDKDNPFGGSLSA